MVLAQDVGVINERLGIVRFEFKRFFYQRSGFFDAPELKQRGAKVVVALGQLGSARQYLPIVRQRALVVADEVAAIAGIQRCERIVRI